MKMSDFTRDELKTLVLALQLRTEQANRAGTAAIKQGNDEISLIHHRIATDSDALRIRISQSDLFKG